MIIEENSRQQPNKVVKLYLANKTIKRFAYETATKAAAEQLKTTLDITDASRLKFNEQREVYRQHRLRMANIKGKVDTHLPPPKVKLEGVRMDLSYMEMMTALYRRSNNTTRTFTKSPERLAAGRMRNAYVARQLEREQEESNRQLHQGGKLFDSYVKKQTRRRYGQYQRTATHEKPFSYEIPLHVLHRYEHLMAKCDINLLCKLLRPQIYFDIALKGTRHRERLHIQLFTEACPQVVLEFMRICTMQDQQRITFTRVLSPLWIEGKMLFDCENIVATDQIEHDFEVLNHGVGAGILSFPCRYVRGSKHNELNFSISFKPLACLNGKRIAFGKIRKGLSLLESLQKMTMHANKNSNPVILMEVGVL